MKCSQCKQYCKELFECDCAEYSSYCETCWQKVPTRHREDFCVVDWLDYNTEETVESR